jgi:hypothetical protein
MWCEEINEKYRELAKDSPWWYHATGDQSITRSKTAGTDQRVPPPARTARQVDLTLQLLAAFYRKPDDFSGGDRGDGTDCHWAEPWAHPMFFPAVRAWMLGNLAAAGPSYFRMREYDGKPSNVLPPQLVTILMTTAVKILVNPDGYGAITEAGQSVISSLCDVIVLTPVIDYYVWPLLWTWAAGGFNGKALIRTRSHALQAISAIARRRPEFVGQSTIVLIEKLAQSVDGITPPKSYADEQERQLFAYTANSAAGDVAAALTQQAIAVPPGLTNPATFLPPGTRPPGFWASLPRWVPIAGSIGLVATFLGAVLLRSSRSLTSNRA